MGEIILEKDVVQRNPNVAFEVATLLGQGMRRCLKLDEVSFAIETDHPIAYESPDHLSPWGAWGNSGSDNTNPFTGGRLWLGWWFTDDHTCGIEANGFYLEHRVGRQTFGSNGDLPKGTGVRILG